MLRSAPAGMVTDLDGTLSEIADTAAAAILVDGARELLSTLGRKLAVAAVVTGRSASDARRILGPVGREVLIVGNHGLEWLPAGSDLAEVPDQADGLRADLEAVLTAVPRAPGVELDDKGLSATVHYRAAPDQESARLALLAAFRVLPPGIELREGRRSVELRPLAAGDKGSAVARIAAQHRLRGLLVAGDDVTDIDMFHAAHLLRAKGVSTLSLAVAGGAEVSGAVRESADATVASPVALVGILAGAAASLAG